MLNIYPVYKYHGKRLTFMEFYQEDIKDLKKSLLKIVPRININDILKLVEEVPYLSNLRKEFFKKSIKISKERILDYFYQKAQSK